MLRLSKNPNVHPRRSQTGEYDTSILCADCDNALGKWDDYACTLLIKEIPQQPIKMEASGRKCYHLQIYDYDRFKLFFLSVLWRMSISTRPSFRHVRLGPFEAQLRETLLKNSAGAATDFAVFVYRYTDQFGSSMMIETRPARLDGIKVYNVGLPGYLAVIKVDDQRIPRPLSPLVLSPHEPLVIGVRDMRKEPEFSFMQQIVVGNYIRRASGPQKRRR